MRTRAMQFADIDAVMDVELTSFVSPWSRDAFENELNNNLGHYLVLEDEDGVVGYAGFWQIFEEGHITNVAIINDKRGRGYGRKLIGDVISRARDLGIERMTLEVRPSNAVAIALYSSFGFKEVGRRPKYYYDTGEDALIMWVEFNDEHTSD